MPQPLHLLTFDIEDWFHVLDNPETQDIAQWETLPSRLSDGVNRILDLCDRIGTKATFFVLGWVAETAPEVVAEIARRGHEIACHSYRHQLAYTQTPEAFEEDLIRALDLIEAAAGVRPTAYRAPGFSVTLKSTWVFDVLARNGIEIDASVFPSSRAHGGLPGFPTGKPCLWETGARGPLKMFPMSFGSVFGRRVVFSGGGYFRLLPYPAIKLGFDRSDYVMTYFHPRDFDPNQPVIPGLGLVRKFKSYVGLGRSLARLERLAGQVNFMSIGDAVGAINWNAVPKLSSQALHPSA